MPPLILRSLILAAFLCVSATALSAQVRPTPEQARALLLTRPDLVQQLRQRISTSGLTPDQIRARLRAEGYPEDLLDAYLPNSSSIPDSSSRGEVFAAVRSLGIVDSLDAELLQQSLGAEERDDRLGLEGDTLPRRRARGAADTLMRADRRARVDSGLTVFGANVFRRGTSQFDANLSGPVDAGYRLGPGDRLVLILTGDVEAAYTLDVTREGLVVIPQVGQINVANLSLAQLEDLLYSRLARVYSGVSRSPGATTRFSISVARLRSNQVFVVGDVAAPGSYRVSSAGTALSALYAAGGPSENGSLRRIEIRRGGRTVEQLDVYDYLVRGDASNDARLQNGDIVFVPVRGPRVRIWGEVVRPATYELRKGETLTDLVQAAGGLTERAASRRIQIERILPPSARPANGGSDRVVLDVTAEQLAAGAVPALPLEAGDVVRVFEVAARVRNRVTVNGSVWAPGVVGLTPGMTLAQALQRAGGVRPDAYLGQVLVTRLRADSTRQQLRAMLRDTTGATVEPLVLQDDDEIQVFALSEFRPTRFVAISGAVRKPGRYAYRSGMSMRDLVLLAGGLHESAFLGEAEIARLPEQRENGRTSTTVRVPLDSSYLFERGPNGRYEGPPGLPAPTGDAPEVELLPYDNVLVLRQPDWELQRTVHLTGEVRFPGRYSLRTKSERLGDLIKRAGGLTPEAYPAGVAFVRAEARLGRIGIDLPRVLADERHRDNLILQDGDSIYIPQYNAVVNVTGAVNSPVAVAFVSGRSLDFYINAAGGPSRRADVKRAYVTQPNGKVEARRARPMLPDGDPLPRAGSVVFVPEKDPADRRDYVATAGAVAQILASIVALIVVVTR
jgi:polysaccharide biosynthesis/export protein